MPSIAPITASGSRDLKRPRAVPKWVREAIKLMVFGLPDNEAGAAVDFVTAARHVGMEPFLLRRYFDRADVRALLRSERRAFREMINSGNELALRSIRDTAQNSMARIGAARMLEDLAEREVVQTRTQQTSPGIVIQIVTARPEPAPAPKTIDARPIEPEPDND
jgi:hypothetical protein